MKNHSCYPTHSGEWSIQMILEDEEIESRIESPLNLLNRLRKDLNKNDSNSLRNPIQSIPPTVDQIINNLEDKLKSGKDNIKSKATNIINECLDELKGRVKEIKVEKLASVAAEMNKVIGNKNESKQVSNAQVIIYAPQHNNETHYEVIHVSE